MFVLKKLIQGFIEAPGIFITLLVLIQIIWKKKIEKAPQRGLLILTILFCLFSLPFFAKLIISPLEKITMEKNFSGEKKNSVIVVMGGGAQSDVPSIPGVRGNYEIGQDSLLRVYTAFLAHQKTNFPIYVSGGNYDYMKGKTAGEMMMEVLLSWGVNKNKVICEKNARTSKENAENIMPMLSPEVEKIYLVTTAIHMKRSHLLFQREVKAMEKNIEILPLACNFVSTQGTSIYSFIPDKVMFYNAMGAIHEYLGLLFYHFF